MSLCGQGYSGIVLSSWVQLLVTYENVLECCWPLPVVLLCQAKNIFRNNFNTALSEQGTLRMLKQIHSKAVRIGWVDPLTPSGVV